MFVLKIKYPFFLTNFRFCAHLSLLILIQISIKIYLGYLTDLEQASQGILSQSTHGEKNQSHRQRKLLYRQLFIS